MKNLSGNRFGKLTAIEPTDQRKNRYIMWRCKCDCGNTLLVQSQHLQRGTILDCGCTSAKACVKLDNQRFGKLLVLSEVEGRNYKGTDRWKCQCDCGKSIIVSGKQLLSGERSHCGCLPYSSSRDLIGQRFGRLTVIAYENKQHDFHYWRCKCDCGNEKVVRHSSLVDGATKSCGCLPHTQPEHALIDSMSSNKLKSDNKSGVRGVCWQKERNKWMANISYKGKRYYLGVFADKEDALKARKDAEEKLSFLFAQGQADDKTLADALSRKNI